MALISFYRDQSRSNRVSQPQPCKTATNRDSVSLETAAPAFTPPANRKLTISNAINASTFPKQPINLAHCLSSVCINIIKEILTSRWWFPNLMLAAMQLRREWSLGRFCWMTWWWWWVEYFWNIHRIVWQLFEKWKRFLNIDWPYKLNQSKQDPVDDWCPKTSQANNQNTIWI